MADLPNMRAMKFVMRIVAVAVLMAGSAVAQLAITNGGFSVKFPSAEWEEYEPPQQLKDLISKHGDLLLYAEAPTGKFFVSQFMYPKGARKDEFVAGFLNGSRESAKKDGIKLEENYGTFRSGAWPTYTYTHELENDNFIHSTAIFCVDRIYNVQIVGLKEAKDDLVKCLDGVWIKDAPLAAEMFAKGTSPGMKDQVAAQRIGYVVGKFTVWIAIGVIAIFALVRIMSDGKRKGPPPLPAQVRATTPPPIPPPPPAPPAGPVA